MTDGLVRVAVGDCDQCSFPEVEIGADDAIPLLPSGVKVLLPCEGCGVTAAEAMADTEHQRDINEAAFARFLTNPVLPLFHWSPRARRPQIIRYGLRPRMRPTTHAGDALQPFRAGWVCLADTASWAWALSGGQRSAPSGEWDLWQTWVDKVTDPRIVPTDWANGIHEVRTHHRIYKRNLWHVGSRVKP